MSDYQYYYNSPRNSKACWTCGKPIKFSHHKRGKKGGFIPLDPITNESHQCDETFSSQDNTSNSSIIDHGNQKGIDSEIENKFVKRVGLNLCQQQLLAKLLSPDPSNDAILKKIEDMTKEIEAIKQILDERNCRKITSSSDDGEKRESQ